MTQNFELTQNFYLDYYRTFLNCKMYRKVLKSLLRYPVLTGKWWHGLQIWTGIGEHCLWIFDISDNMKDIWLGNLSISEASLVIVNIQSKNVIWKYLINVGFFSFGEKSYKFYSITQNIIFLVNWNQNFEILPQMSEFFDVPSECDNFITLTFFTFLNIHLLFEFFI